MRYAPTAAPRPARPVIKTQMRNRGEAGDRSKLGERSDIVCRVNNGLRNRKSKWDFSKDVKEDGVDSKGVHKINLIQSITWGGGGLSQ